jgi:hypothetical protein
MILPKSKNKKLINLKDFVKIAEKVKKSFEEEEKYLRDKGIRNGYHLSCGTYSHT